MTTPRRKVTINAGASWSDSFLWLRVPYVYRDVDSVEKGLPTKLLVESHGLPIGYSIPIAITNSGSLKIDTTQEAPAFATVENEDSLVLHGVNTIKRQDTTTTVRIVYLTPVDLTGFTAKIQFKTSIDGPVLVELIDGEGINIVNSGAVSLFLTDDQTKLLIGNATDMVQGIAQLELTSPTGVVTRLVQYDWTANPEWTKEVP